MKRAVSCFLLCSVTLLCGCSKAPRPKTPIIADRPQKNIPADSFLLNIEAQPTATPGRQVGPNRELKGLEGQKGLEGLPGLPDGPIYPSKPVGPTKPVGPVGPVGSAGPSPASELEIKKTVSLERSATAEGEFFKPLTLLVGTGEQIDSMSGINGAIDPNQRTLITIIVKAVEKEGNEGNFFRLRIEAGNESKPDAGSFEVDNDFPLLKGHKLADVLTINVQPGLYKIGNPVRLGSVLLDSKEPLTLHVRWSDDLKRLPE